MALKRLLSVVEEKLAPHIAMCEADSDMERIYSQKEVLLLSRSKNTKMTQNALHPSPQLTAAQLARHAPETVPRFRTSRLQRNAERREQQRTNDNTGYKWFNLPAVKMTDAVKSELKLLKVRSLITLFGIIHDSLKLCHSPFAIAKFFLLKSKSFWHLAYLPIFVMVSDTKFSLAFLTISIVCNVFLVT